jgi:hypothetical protein
MKAGSRQNIHYGAPSWPYLTEPITAQNDDLARPIPRPAVTVRDVGPGTAMRRPEPPR